MSAKQTPIAAVLLAAGSSTRMGRPKQMLCYRGLTLVEHAVNEALAAHFEPVIVVVGANAEAVRAAISHLPVEIAENTNWQRGMGSSIATAMRLVPPCDAVAILLVDQPLVTAAHLLAMRGSFDGNIVAARYHDHLGVPAIFPRRLFQSLSALEGNEGARSLLRSPDEDVVAFDLPEAGMDIDTPGDFQSLA